MSFMWSRVGGENVGAVCMVLQRRKENNADDSVEDINLSDTALWRSNFVCSHCMNIIKDVYNPGQVLVKF